MYVPTHLPPFYTFMFVMRKVINQSETHAATSTMHPQLPLFFFAESVGKWWLPQRCRRLVIKAQSSLRYEEFDFSCYTFLSSALTPSHVLIQSPAAPVHMFGSCARMLPTLTTPQPPPPKPVCLQSWLASGGCLLPQRYRRLVIKAQSSLRYEEFEVNCPPPLAPPTPTPQHRSHKRTHCACLHLNHLQQAYVPLLPTLSVCRIGWRVVVACCPSGTGG